MPKSDVLTPIQGIALLCDSQGIIQQIIANNLGLAAAPLVGQALTALVEPSSVEKTQNLLATLHMQRVAFDWLLYVPSANSVIGLHCYAGMVGGQIFIVGTPSQPDAEAFFEALMQINNQHQNTLRQMMKDVAMQQPTASLVQANRLDEFSRLNSELINAQRELAKRNRELTTLAQENAQLYQDAAAALQLRNEFISSITHDLKTPLTTIKGYGEILRRRVTRLELAEPDKLIGPLDTIDATVQRMIEQIEGLLDLARLQMSDTLRINPSEFDLVLLVQRVLKMLAPLLARHQLQFTPLEPSLIGCWDLLYLERMVTNIISNAIKYSPPARLISISLRLESSTTPPQTIMEVCDQGVGIPAAELKRIFEPFYRAENVRKQGIKGTGIGLASVRQIIDLHGGTISVTSEEHVGTCFTIGLPIIPSSTQHGADESIAL
ncbi:MAG: HAMP domain-containing histidine kinase [Herpetosiphonaceae bacterium]|nr:HAMP domain-containing histidine kinase [Herpetosiphonaceae bacterium]